MVHQFFIFCINLKFLLPDCLQNSKLQEIKEYVAAVPKFTAQELQFLVVWAPAAGHSGQWNRTAVLTG